MLIGSTVMSAALLLIVGIPRGRAWFTPRIERVWVVSAALGDPVAGVAPSETLEGTPVTLYALIEARPRGADATVIYGTLDTAVLEPGSEAVQVHPWSDWWLQPEFFWFKVAPTYPFANDDFDATFTAAQIEYTDSYQVSWGFGWSHAADIRPVADAYPDWSTGTMRFRAQAVIRDSSERFLQRAESPGGDAVSAPSAAQAPHRVTVRAGDDGFGHLLAFAGLPYVPFSAITAPGTHPVERVLGGTVLGFWLQAQRLAGTYHGPLVSWERLDEIADLVVDDMFLANDGTYYFTSDPRQPVTYDAVQPGDLLVIEDHIGVLYEDRGPGGGGDGILNRWDRLLEAYFGPLRDTAAGDAFVADTSVYRLRPAASDK